MPNFRVWISILPLICADKFTPISWLCLPARWFSRLFSSETRPVLGRVSIQKSSSSQSNMRVLVVEDHKDTREVLTGLLTRWGYIVASADTLKDGLHLLESQPPVDVILSDIALPDGTGYALVAEARRRGHRALAIAIYGYTFSSDVQ